MKIARYVETCSYIGMFNTMNFAYYICLVFILPFMQHPVFTWFAAAEARVRGPPASHITGIPLPIICPFLQQSVNVLSAIVVRAGNERS